MPGRQTPDSIQIGKNIRARIEAVKGSLLPAGGPQAELARRVGVSTTTMWRYLDGDPCPLPRLGAIARELGVSVDDLLVGTKLATAGKSLTAKELTQEDYLRIMRLSLAAAEELAGGASTFEARKQFDDFIRAHALRLKR